MKNAMVKVMMTATVAGCLAATAMAADTQGQETEQVVLSVEEAKERVGMGYSDIISEVVESVNNGWKEVEPEVMNLSDLLEKAEQKEIGFKVADLNGNGIDDLALGRKDVNGKDEIFDLFLGNEDGTIEHVFSAGERDSFYMLKDNMIKEEGSSSAEESFTAILSLEDGVMKMKEALVFDGLADAQNPWFFNHEGKTSENATGITAEMAEAFLKKYEDVVTMDYTMVLPEEKKVEKSIAASVYTAVVTCDGLNVREASSTDAAVVTTLNNGAKVEVTGVEMANGAATGWIRISMNGRDLFVSGQYLKKQENKKEEKKETVKTDAFEAVKIEVEEGTTGEAEKLVPAEEQKAVPEQDEEAVQEKETQEKETQNKEIQEEETQNKETQNKETEAVVTDTQNEAPQEDTASQQAVEEAARQAEEEAARQAEEEAARQAAEEAARQAEEEAARQAAEEEAARQAAEEAARQAAEEAARQAAEEAARQAAEEAARQAAEEAARQEAAEKKAQAINKAKESGKIKKETMKKFNISADEIPGVEIEE